MTETILVTGGASLVGKNTLEELAKIEGVRLVTTLRPERQGSQIPQGIDISYTDLRITADQEKVFLKYRPETVMHIAARSDIKESLDNAIEYVEDNPKVTLSLLDLSRRYGTKRFIFTSTGQVYNKKSNPPFSEETPSDMQDSIYAASKRACELFCYTYSSLSDMKIICLRLSNIYGPGMREGTIIPQLVEKAYSGEPFRMQGDGTTTRDYLDVRDLVKAIILTLKLDTSFEILNIGSGRSTEIRELVRIVEKISGRKVNIETQESKPSQDKRISLDITKAGKLLGWRPEISLEEGIKKYIEGYKSAGAQI